MMPQTIPATVAGAFYPRDPVELTSAVRGYLTAGAHVVDCLPRAIIAPHAGYDYSGPVAGSAYAHLQRVADRTVDRPLQFRRYFKQAESCGRLWDICLRGGVEMIRLRTISALVFLCGCTSQVGDQPGSDRKGDSVMALNLRSTAFADGQPIPTQYTDDGEDVSPPLAWDAGPSPTKEFALICDDPDAPTDEPWVHWVIYKIPPDITSLPEGLPNDEILSEPEGVLQGKNSFTSGAMIGYRGPAPPKGHGTHHYHFKLYALDTKLDLGPGATKKELLAAMGGYIVAEGELVGTYQR